MESGKIRYILWDFDGVFTFDNYDAISNAFSESSGIEIGEIEARIGEFERRYVLVRDLKNNFLKELKREFNFPGPIEKIRDLMNDRGDTGLYELLSRFEESGIKQSILSNQIGFRVPYVRDQLQKRFGIDMFAHVYLSPEIGLQKPFVGVKHNEKESAMDTTNVDIFPLVVKDAKKLGYGLRECLFIDDSQKNIDSAQSCGIQGMLFTPEYQKDLNLFLRDLESQYGIKV
ncbi:MAG: hypothetical protein ABIH49_03320 [archaeon]